MPNEYVPKEYRVLVVIDVTDENPEAAAAQAWDLLRHMAPYPNIDVIDANGMSHVVDLEAETILEQQSLRAKAEQVAMKIVSELKPNLDHKIRLELAVKYAELIRKEYDGYTAVIDGRKES